MSENAKELIVKSVIVSSIGVFILHKRMLSSRFVTFQSRLWWERFVDRNFSFSKSNPIHTCLSYALFHQSGRHLAFNMALVYVLGNQVAASALLSANDMIGVAALSAAATAWTEAPFLGTNPIVGASGVAMGYLGCLTVLDPEKAWLMVLPIPGVPMTTLQLCQASVVGHVAMLLWKGIYSRTRIALRGHLAGLAMGYLFTRSRVKTEDYDLFNTSKTQWIKSLTSAELVVYWMYLSIRLMLPTPFTNEGEVGLLRAKQRFIRRTWRDDF
jgi:membrane associated rhomboid family serine protease